MRAYTIVHHLRKGCPKDRFPTGDSGDIIRVEARMWTPDIPEILIAILTLAGIVWAAYHFWHGEPKPSDRTR